MEETQAKKYIERAKLMSNLLILNGEPDLHNIKYTKKLLEKALELLDPDEPMITTLKD